MPFKLVRVKINKLRSLFDVSVSTEPLNVIFGPNGSGKSTFLDAIWFLRDCAIRGVDMAASFRTRGIGILWDGSEESETIAIALETESTEYQVSFGYSAGRIEHLAGERLHSKDGNLCLIDRKVGSDKATIYNRELEKYKTVTLKYPEKLALNTYVAREDSEPVAAEIDNFLRFVRFYNSKAASLSKLKRFSSESDAGDRLQDRCENLWSVLRNLQGRRAIDERYDTIIKFMREGFPSFNELVFEPTGPNTVYASFVEEGRRKPIQASGVSDGHIQLLINLTALFSEGQDRYALILFDEPEISLHPWALKVFADAVKLATEKWNKQTIISTHSPALISQFEPEDIWAAEVNEAGKTVMRRASEMAEIQDLLEEYATGSLYMAEMIAPQSKSQFDGEV